MIAIARHGRLVALDAYGWRDKAAGVAMTTDTIFNIASMTKPMTAVGGLMLYEQGKLLIDDPLANISRNLRASALRRATAAATDRRYRAGRSPDHDPGPDAAYFRNHLWRARQHPRAQAISSRQQRRGDHG